MLVKVPVSWQGRAFDEDTLTVTGHESTLDMWIDPADLVEIPHPADAGGVPSSYKRDVTAMRVDTDERFRLCGCWSHRPGELIADMVTPIKEKEFVGT